MIVANISNDRFVLASLDDAEALLRILTRATPVVDRYEIGAGKTHYVEQAQGSLGLSINAGRIITNDEYKKMLADKKAESDQE